MDNFKGEIRMFTVGYVPSGWLPCDGTLFPKNGRYRDLASIIGIQFGGDDNNFRVPDLRGKVPVGMGVLNNVNYVQGVKGGTSGTVLTEANIPLHSHIIKVATGGPTDASPEGNLLCSSNNFVYDSGADMKYATMDSKMVTTAAPPVPVSNIQPVLGVMFGIAFDGIYPQPT